MPKKVGFSILSLLIAAAMMSAMSAAFLAVSINLHPPKYCGETVLTTILDGDSFPEPTVDTNGRAAGDESADYTPPLSERCISVYFHNEAVTRLMGLEDYICGVLAAEMPSTFAVEALKAGAVAARSYAVYRSGRDYAAHPSASVCTNPAHCQAYRDPNSLSVAAREKIIGAVTATAGVVVTYNGRVIEALYHSSSNKMTLSAAYVFGNDVPYLRPVETPEAAVTKTVRLGDATLAAIFSLSDRAVAAAASPPSLLLDSIGRVCGVSFAGANVTGSRFKTLSGLLTTDFEIIAAPDGYSAISYGFGHGVGMSQYGANTYAERGQDYRWILEHYYSGVDAIGVNDRST